MQSELNQCTLAYTYNFSLTECQVIELLSYFLLKENV